MEWFKLNRVMMKTGVQAALVCLLFLVVSPVSGADETDEANSNETERYQLVTWDFHHVEVPYVICLWILLASLAKIGEYLQIFCHARSVYQENSEL